MHLIGQQSSCKPTRCCHMIAAACSVHCSTTCHVTSRLACPTPLPRSTNVLPAISHSSIQNKHGIYGRRVKNGGTQHTDELRHESDGGLSVGLGAGNTSRRATRFICTDHSPEILVFSQQLWLRYDFVVAALRREMNCTQRGQSLPYLDHGANLLHQPSFYPGRLYL